MASNHASDFLISPPLFERLQPDFADYAERGWAAVTAAADQVASAGRPRSGRRGWLVSDPFR